MASLNPNLFLFALLVFGFFGQNAHSKIYSNSIAHRRRSLRDLFVSSSANPNQRKKCPSRLREESPSVPLVQIKKRSNDEFICNGLLVTNQMVLTTANCVDELTYTSKFVVGFVNPFGNGTRVDIIPKSNTKWIGINWACKHPEYERWRGAHHNTGLVVLDEPIKEEHFRCMMQLHKVGPHVPGSPGSNRLPRHGEREAILMRVKGHDRNSRQSIKIDRLSIDPYSISCRSNEIIPAGTRMVHFGGRSLHNQASFCSMKINQSAALDLCNLESAFVLIPGVGGVVTGPGRSMNNLLGLVDVSHESLDSGKCLTQPRAELELKVVNLSKLWTDGHLHRLINYCSKSRR